VNLQINSLAGTVAFLEEQLAEKVFDAEVAESLAVMSTTLNEVNLDLENRIK
jgi:hypothetical protein